MRVGILRGLPWSNCPHRDVGFNKLHIHERERKDDNTDIVS